MTRQPEDAPPASGSTSIEASLAALLEQSAEELYEHAPCGYLSMLPDGTVIKVNETFLDWTSWRREEVVGRRLQTMLTPGGQIYFETHCAPLLEMQGSLREIALEIALPDGQRLPVILNAALARNTTGAPAIVRTTIFDATERRGYERELLRARREAEAETERARLLARTLQESLIPPEPAQIPGLRVGAAYRPAGDGAEVGGDFYDVFQNAPSDWAIVVGDVCGKGAGAAAVTALARYTIRAAAIRGRRPSTVLATLNRALLRAGTERFVTLLYARVRSGRDGTVLTIAAGGHPLPLLARGEGEPREIGRPGDLLGIFEEATTPDSPTRLRPGDRIVFFTDGVIEGRRDGEQFGASRLRALIADAAALDAHALATRIVEEVVEFQGGITRDDVAIVVLEVPAPAEPEPPA